MIDEESIRPELVDGMSPVARIPEAGIPMSDPGRDENDVFLWEAPLVDVNVFSLVVKNGLHLNTKTEHFCVHRL